MKLKKVFAIVAMLLIVFIAGCEKKVDDTGGRPTVTSTNPANLATQVAVNRIVVVEFSEPMDNSTITDLTFTLKQGATPVPGVVTYTGSSARFAPSANLTPGKIYSGTITSGVKNEAGIGMLNNHTFSFTTGAESDNIAPTMSSNNPLNNATAVARDKAVSINFSEAMDPATLNAAFTLKQGTTSVPGKVTVSGTTATFTPTNVLNAETVYTASISTGAKDLAGNALAAGTSWNFTTKEASATLAAVNLGTAGGFAILAKTKISTTGTTHITGNIGISPAAATYLTGFGQILPAGGAFSTSSLVTGNIYAPGYAVPTPSNMTTAISNMETAYTDAAGRTLPDFTELYAGNIGGKTLVAGLYKWSSTVIAPVSFTISGSATDVWIFQISKDLTMSSAINVTLAGGALAKNIFWQVAGIATLGTTSHFEGNILCKTGITFKTGASLNGRALAQSAVVLDATVIVKPQ